MSERLHPDDLERIARRVAELSRAESDELMTAQQVAELWRVSERYIWRLGREGVLPRVTLPGGKYVRFRRSDVVAAQGTRGAATHRPEPISSASQRAPRATPERKRF